MLTNTQSKRPAPKPSEKAFSGQLVGQDPSDEPATDLLARIREARELLAQEVKKLPQKKRARKKDVAHAVE